MLQVAAPPKALALQSAECDVCKIIALYLNKFVASNGTEVSQSVSLSLSLSLSVSLFLSSINI